MLELHFDWILRVRFLVDMKAGDCPGTLDLRTALLQVANENAFNQSLVQQSGERVSRVDEAWATSPRASSDNALAIPWRVPECDLVDPGRLVGHDSGLQAHVAEEIQGSWLDAIGTASRGWLSPVVNVLYFVAPSCQARRKHQSNRTRTHDDWTKRLVT